MPFTWPLIYLLTTTLKVLVSRINVLQKTLFVAAFAGLITLIIFVTQWVIDAFVKLVLLFFENITEL